MTSPTTPPTPTTGAMQPPRRLSLPAVFTLVLALVLSGFVGVEQNAPAPDPTVRALQAELLRMVSTSGWPSAEWGISAVSVRDGETLFALNEDAALAPASNVKLFTAAAALHFLGPEYRFPTFLLTDGEVRDGVLQGNLILYGTGDPSISDKLLPSRTHVFEGMAAALREAGIHRIEGEVLGDGTFFDGPSRHPSWNSRDLNDWFTAPVSALSFNENVVTLRLGPSWNGGPPRVLTVPEGAALRIDNQGVTVAGARGQSLLIAREDPDGPIEIRGRIGTGQPEVWRRLTVSDPAEYAASILRHVLEKEGIRVDGGVRSIRDRAESTVTGTQIVAPAFGRNDDAAGPRLRTLAIHHSPPLPELLAVVNKESHNLYAELLLFAMGRISAGDGSFTGGARVLTDYLVRQVGLAPESLNVVDGSGLSRLNRSSAAGFVRLLRHMHGSEHATPFFASLPEAGNRRELGRMYQSAAAGNLRAKTGTIDRVSALSGIVTSAQGEPIVFSIMVNNVPSPWAVKRVEDRIGIRLASFDRPAGVLAGAPAGDGTSAVRDARDDRDDR